LSEKQYKQVEEEVEEEKRHEEYWRKKQEKREVFEAWVCGILMGTAVFGVLFKIFWSLI